VLAGNNGVQSPTYNGAANLILAGNGTATLNGGAASNWFAPTTASIGSGFYISVTQTGGAGSFTGLSGVTNITNSGLTIGVSGTGVTFSATGTYSISSDAAGLVVLGSGTITLTGSNVQSPNWSGTTPLNLAGNGSATLNGVTTSDWLTPNAANSGSGFWINITRTGGTGGVNFSAAQGSWTNITNSGLTIDITGYTGDVGTVTSSGTYQISSSSSGTPVLGSGTISLSLSGLTVTRTYTTPVTGATETVPTGATLLTIKATGAGASGQVRNPGTGQGGGGGGFVVSTSVAVTGGQTFTYSVGTAGAATTSVGLGTAGTSSTVSGTGVAITAGGGQAASGAGGIGGTATGGNTTNSVGQTGGTILTNFGGNNGNGTGGGIPGGGAPGGGSSGINFPNSTTAGGNGQVQFVYT
jgi:hypothetical protein